MSIGYRRQGDNGPLYHPERDYAYITPTLMRQAIENLEAPPSEEMKRWRDEQKITDEEIVAAADALAEAQRHFVSCADPVTSLEQALNREGWQKLRYAVQQYLLAAVGEVVLGAWFNAVREVTIKGEESPAQNEMCRFSGVVRMFCQRHGAPILDSTSVADTLLLRQDILLGQLQQMHKEKLQLRQEKHELELKLARVTKSWWWRFFYEKTDYTGPK